jgi:hypothetical protein
MARINEQFIVSVPKKADHFKEHLRSAFFMSNANEKKRVKSGRKRS